MPRKYFLQIVLVSFGIALLFAGLFFDMSTASPQDAKPTPDRLAKPTLPAEPSQADKGAQVYWLSCLPCHGERGQGLTAEFIETYPAEDRNCWTSRCHGDHPYEHGFTLPASVPAIIGAGTLQKFPNAFVLRSYIFSAMPYWKPASLTEEETWQVTAFILRENKQWTAQQELNASNAGVVLIGTPAAESAPRNSSHAISIFSISGVLILILFFVFQRLRKK